MTLTLPRENLVRAMFPAVEVRTAGDGAMPTLTGHFAVFNQWTKIDSIWEGTFMERIAPGAFRKTIAENRDQVRVLFQHGQDPQIGDKPLGPIESLSEDKQGAFYEVPLLDTSYNRDLLPALQAGLYGASFRFRVTKEELAQAPKKSAHNPDALPERTISELHLMEFGPVTFPAYAGATAGVRSMTDDFIIESFAEQPERLAALIERMGHPHPPPEPEPPTESLEEPPEGGSSDSDALPIEGAGSTTPPRAAAVRPRKFQTREEYLEWISRT